MDFVRDVARKIVDSSSLYQFLTLQGDLEGLPITSTSRTVNRPLSTSSKSSRIDFLTLLISFLAVATTRISVV